jgi:hypothetical protein
MDVLTRLDRLERENKLLKRIFLLSATVLGAFVLMAQAPSSKTIEAEKIVLRTGGRIFAELGIDSSGTPALAFFNDKHDRVAEYRSGDAMIVKQDRMSLWNADVLTLSGPEGHLDLQPINFSIRDNKNGLGEISMGMKPSLQTNGAIEPVLFLSGNNGQGFIQMSSMEGLHLEPGSHKGQALPGGTIDISPFGPSIEITDQKGFRSTLGNVKLTVERSGEDRFTSASSLVMFDKNGKVIWSAP